MLKSNVHLIHNYREKRKQKEGKKEGRMKRKEGEIYTKQQSEKKQKT